MITGVAFAFGARSDVGNVRRMNEDRFVASPPVFAVADGMGGHARGDVASALVAEEFSLLARRPSLSADDVVAVVERANRIVHDAGCEDPAQRGMGTTLVAAALVESEGTMAWLIANVGDSRAYSVKEGQISQLTVDHSAVQELIDEGVITSEEARVHPERNVITRAMGIRSEVVADFVLHVPVPGERLVLCSDGVHGELSEDQLRGLVATSIDPQTAADTVIERVLAGPARDNATVVIVEFVARAADVVDDVTGPVRTVIAEVPKLLRDEGDRTAEQIRRTQEPLIVDVPFGPAGDPGDAATSSTGVTSTEVIEVPEW